MSWSLRIEMLLLAVVMAIIVIRCVTKKKMRVQYSLIWIFISLALLVVSIFPGAVFFLCSLLGMQTPSNLIFLLGIIALLLVALVQTSIISKQAENIKFLTQIVSIEKYQRKLEEERHEN